MDKEFLEKIEIIKKINTDDSNFIINVYESFKKNQIDIKNKKNSTSIIINNNNVKNQNNVINLDTLWAKPYLYTKMRLKLDGIINEISKIKKSDILNKPYKTCKNIIFNNYNYSFEKTNNQVDIVEFIKSLIDIKKNNPDENLNFMFLAKQIDEETLFKEEQLKVAIKIINTNDLTVRNRMIYDDVYNYLMNNFISNNYCNFINNKCVAQRNHQFYPFNKKNGCCFKQIRECENLKNKNCTVECLPCRLFSCPYLSKRGIGYFASDFILLKSFFTKKQRKHLVFDFYESKEKILEKINNIND